MIVIISCGQRKRNERSRARDLYTGPYFRAALEYAEAVTTPEKIYILSAKHGLLRPTYYVSPYELRLGQTGSVIVRDVRRQARNFHLLPMNEPVMVIAGKRYQQFLMNVFDSGLVTPCFGGMGKQIQFLRTQAKALINAKETKPL
jgi:hypothetical protein